MIAALLTAGAACMNFALAHRQPEVKFDPTLESLSMDIGEWHGQEVQVDAGSRKAMGADRVLCRYYTDSRTGEQVSLLIVCRKHGRREFAHRPELCYPAIGWEITSRGYTHIPYAGRDVRARVVEAERDDNVVLVTYWFVSGRRAEANYIWQQAKMALDRLHTQRYGWAFIRVDVMATGGREEALNHTRAFMEDIEKPLADILIGSE